MVLKLKLELPRIFAIRRFQPDGTKEERRHSNGIQGGGDHSTLPLVSRSLPISTIVSPSAKEQPDLPVSTNIHPIQSSSNSSDRQVLSGANVALTVISPITGAVPIVGSSIQAAINGLLVILNAVDQIGQNKEDIRELRSKLYDLDKQIYVIPAAGHDFDISRDRLIRQLNETSDTLKALCERRIFQYSFVAKAINQCVRDIDSHLAQFSALNNMQLANYAKINDDRVDRIDSRVDMINSRTESTERNTQEIMTAMKGLIQHMSKGVMYMMDATGRQHSVPMYMAGSFNQFNEAIRVLFRPETAQGRLLRTYMDVERYYLSIDNGRQVQKITDDAQWSRVQPGTTVVMSVLVLRPRYGPRVYQCPFCKVENSGGELSQRSTLDCLGCGRHITEAEEMTYHPGEELGPIRNIHVIQYVGTT